MGEVIDTGGRDAQAFAFDFFDPSAFEQSVDFSPDGFPGNAGGRAQRMSIAAFHQLPELVRINPGPDTLTGAEKTAGIVMTDLTENDRHHEVSVEGLPQAMEVIEEEISHAQEDFRLVRFEIREGERQVGREMTAHGSEGGIAERMLRNGC